MSKPEFIAGDRVYRLKELYHEIEKRTFYRLETKHRSFLEDADEWSNFGEFDNLEEGIEKMKMWRQLASKELSLKRQDKSVISEIRIIQ